MGSKGTDKQAESLSPDAESSQFPVLVGRERASKFVVAHVVPFKGGGVDWVVSQLVRDLRKMGIH